MPNPRALRRKIQELREDVSAEGDALAARWKPWVRRREFAFSALNLAHYLALRRRDLRRLQEALMPWGLSSLGRCESRVLPTLDGVLASLDALCREQTPGVEHPDPRAYFRGLRFLERRARRALGPAPPEHHVRVMVTLPGEAATEPGIAKALLERGASCFRINCAHDGAEAWEAMGRHVRRAEQEIGRPARILMDLAGPKLRIAAVSERARLERGLRFLLTREEPVPGASPVEASCAEPGVVETLRVGERVFVDDGSAVATVVSLEPRGALLEVTRSKGKKLKPEKGLNFPDSDLRVPSLGSKDLADLDSILRIADLVGYSFVRSADDVALLQDEMRARLPDAWRSKGIIAKIETPLAVRNLPDIIVRGAGSQPFGVMIARGDLAVELGFVRIAEIQEELLWLCEAAHVPVIWATQVLEAFVKNGIPTRAEMTDAAMATRAECVMLNKGPFVADAVHVLGRVLSRMEAHQFKKTPQLRALQAWR
ncbi:MAG TPA: pyruvate kinase [Thermoanaerobaculia bacterium]|nr:pyruvate kinase [Thermoanaerobaculia bacterium]